MASSARRRRKPTLFARVAAVITGRPLTPVHPVQPNRFGSVGAQPYTPSFTPPAPQESAAPPARHRAQPVANFDAPAPADGIATLSSYTPSQLKPPSTAEELAAMRSRVLLRRAVQDDAPLPMPKLTLAPVKQSAEVVEMQETLTSAAAPTQNIYAMVLAGLQAV